MTNFWQTLTKPFFILAPMEAVTDVVFRHVIAIAARPDVFFSEFTNAASYCSPKGIASTRGRLEFTRDEQPIVAQIWGNRPEQFEQMSYGLAKQGYSGIDINMGCPDKSVVKDGSGSALINQPDLASNLIASTKKAGLAVSVKTRLGYNKPDEYESWLTHLLSQDLSNLTVHLRTRKDMSKVDARFELIPEIKKLRDRIAPQTLLTINGDIIDRSHGKELVDRYGVDGIMIGRGVFANPFAFEYDKRVHSKTELINLLRLHLDLHDKYSLELGQRRFDPLKRFFKIYIREFDGASQMREKLMQTKSSDEARMIIDDNDDDANLQP